MNEDESPDETEEAVFFLRYVPLRQDLENMVQEVDTESSRAKNSRDRCYIVTSLLAPRLLDLAVENERLHRVAAAARAKRRLDELPDIDDSGGAAG